MINHPNEPLLQEIDELLEQYVVITINNKPNGCREYNYGSRFLIKSEYSCVFQRKTAFFGVFQAIIPFFSR